MITHLKFILRWIAPLGAGLGCAQILATWHVWQSNQQILRQSQAVTGAGWLAIPCGPAIAALSTFKAAFWGGLFFSLSLGAGLCLVTWGMLLIIGRNRLRNWFGRMLIALIWVMLLLTINFSGILVWESLFVILVPLVFGWVYIKCGVESRTGAPRYLRLVAPASLILLAALWFSQYNSELFVTIRDQLLLSNPAGRSVNAFYYQYTLYPAEAFKSFEQKTVRTCSLSGVKDPQLARRLADRLIALNVLPLNDFQPVDLNIQEEQSQLVLNMHGSLVLTVPVQVFEKDTGAWLIRFSAQSDRYEGLRSLIVTSLVLAFPILLFMIVFGMLHIVVGFFLKPVAAAWTTAGLCLGIGVLLLVPVQSINIKKQDQTNLAERLRSSKRADHLVALRYVEQHKLALSAFPEYERFLASRDIAERYWSARALSYDRGPAIQGHLLALLSDPEPIVRCQALYALGLRGEVQAIAPIYALITSTGHWYVQWYGYGALRKLGWHQKPLP
jgi:hypothetical protein